MLEKMADVAAQIATERAELETQMDDLEQAKNDLAEQQTEMEKQRAESDQLILQMAAEYDSMSEEYRTTKNSRTRCPRRQEDRDGLL